MNNAHLKTQPKDIFVAQGAILVAHCEPSKYSNAHQNLESLCLARQCHMLCPKAPIRTTCQAYQERVIMHSDLQEPIQTPYSAYQEREILHSILEAQIQTTCSTHQEREILHSVLEAQMQTTCSAHQGSVILHSVMPYLC